MTARSTYVCDGCGTRPRPMPIPDGRALVGLIEALHDAHWTTPLPGVWLCPACAEVTQIEGVQAQTEAMF